MEIPNIIIPYNKNDVEEGIINIQELINIFHSRSIFEQEKSNNSATCETLRQLSLTLFVLRGAESAPLPHVGRPYLEMLDHFHTHRILLK